MKKKIYYRIVSVILCLVLVFTIDNLCGNITLVESIGSHAETILRNPTTNTSGVTTWDCIYFGNYPQSEYTPKQPPKNPESGKEYTDSDGTKMLYMEGIREEYSEEIYNYVDVEYQVYYKIEPIKWRVLAVDGDDVFLLADKNLDCKPYNETNANISWEDCSLQKWVNTDFLNGAFSGLQQLAVKQTRRAVEDNSGTGASGISYSTEKIYLLSNIEATNPAYGFCAGSQKESETKEVKNTDYASECGAATCTEEDYNGNGYSWLRSAAGNMSIVHYDGNSFGGLNVTSKFCGVRPALYSGSVVKTKI